MSAMMIGVVLLILVGLGVGIYFLMNAKKCKDHETQGECKEPCQWDTYGGKCIDENGILTPAPAPAPRQDPADAPDDDDDSPTSSVPGFDKVDMFKGHPLVRPSRDVIADSDPVAYHNISHQPFPRGIWHMVRAGDAKKPEVCYQYAKDNNLSNWGWRKHDKSCWSYMDPTIGIYGAHPGSQTSHKWGCTKEGVKITDGCRDMKKGDIVWGHTTGWQNIDHDKKMTFEECRDRAKEEGYTAFGYRTNLHPQNQWTATCGGYDEIPSDFIGNGGDTNHITACVNDSKLVRNQCT
jgi:hypothetical protein